MKTTLDLPDDLMRAVKIRAVQENLALEDAVAELLRRGLAQPSSPARAVAHRVQLPLVECARAAEPDVEMTPERVAALLLEDEAGARVPLR